MTDTRVRYLVLALLLGLGEAFGGKKKVKEPEPVPMPVPEAPAAEDYDMPVAWLAVAVLLAALFVVLAYLLMEHGKQPGGKGYNISMGLFKEGGVPTAKKSGGWPLYTLVEKQQLSKDSMKLRFKIPAKGVSKLAVGRHVMCRAEINDERVVRPYTPTVLDAGGGFLELVVKAYDQAKMSRHLHALEPGTGAVEMFGPVGSLKYSPASFNRLVFLAAGTGITPVYAMAKAVLADPADATTTLVILYQNREPQDVLLKDELVALAAANPTRLSLVLACSRAPKDFSFKHGTVEQIAGYLDAKVIDAHLAKHNPAKPAGAKVLICGPGGFNDGVTALCQAQGYGTDATKDLLHLF